MASVKRRVNVENTREKYIGVTMFPENVSAIILGALIAHHAPRLTQCNGTSWIEIGFCCGSHLSIVRRFHISTGLCRSVTKSNEYDVYFSVIPGTY
jgi:hypothetical protein